MPAATRERNAAARGAVAAHGFWYHTMELAPGVVTPGWFDLRPILEKMPWPDLRGKRCLEVGPYDGHLSFEMERRGAADVVAADIGSPWDWDWPRRSRKQGPEAVAAISGERTGQGFAIARSALGSSAERVEINAYDLSPETVGTFDFVLCGSLMLHLRDPVRALEAIRGICQGQFLSAETIDPVLTLLQGSRPAARLRGGELCQWWIPNPAGHRSMLEAAGFGVESAVRPYAIPFGPNHPRARGLPAWSERLLTAAVTRGVGVPHAAALCRPAPDDVSSYGTGQ